MVARFSETERSVTRRRSIPEKSETIKATVPNGPFWPSEGS